MILLVFRNIKREREPALPQIIKKRRQTRLGPQIWGKRKNAVHWLERERGVHQSHLTPFQGERGQPSTPGNFTKGKGTFLVGGIRRRGEGEILAS